MRRTYKVISAVLSSMLTLSLLAGCGGAKGNSFTSADVVDGGATQQRWLRDYESTMIINPDAVGQESYTNDANNLSLSVGLVDQAGNVTKTANDILFMLESKSSNGKGGEIVHDIVFEAGADGAVKGLSKLTSNNSTGHHFVGTTPESGDITMKMNSWKWEMEDTSLKDVYAVIDIHSITDVLHLSTILGNPYIELGDNINTDKPGLYMVNLYDIYRTGSPESNGQPRTVTPQIKLTKAGSYDFDAYFCVFPDGFSVAPVNATHTWAPYGITSKLSYASGTTVNTVDTIIGQSVSRTVTCEAPGELCFAGKIYGTPTYDSKDNVITVACDGYTYSVAPKRKGTITYYNSVEDIMNAENGSEEYSGQSYWMLKLTALTAGDSFNIGVSMSDTLTADEINELAINAASTTKVNKYVGAVVERWDTYIAENDVSAYITKIPE